MEVYTNLYLVDNIAYILWNRALKGIYNKFVFGFVYATINVRRKGRGVRQMVGIYSIGLSNGSRFWQAIFS